MTFFVELGLGEADPELDLPGARTAPFCLAWAPRCLLWHHRHTGAVYDDVELLRWPTEWYDLAFGDGVGLSLDDRRQCRAVGLGDSLDALRAQGNACQLGEQSGAFHEGHCGAHPIRHGPKPRRDRRASEAEGVVFGHHPCVAVLAVVVGPIEADRAQSGVEGLLPIGDEVCSMSQLGTRPSRRDGPGRS